jgi:hypothetical protein
MRPQIVFRALPPRPLGLSISSAGGLRDGPWEDEASSARAVLLFNPRGNPPLALRSRLLLAASRRAPAGEDPHSPLGGRQGEGRRARTLCALVLLVAASLPACGRVAPPRPPEDVAPQTISDLRATNAAEGIQLSWSRPLNYADGTRMSDLASFTVERAVGTEPRPAFRRLTVLEVSDRDRFRPVKHFQYVDRDTNAETTYQYRVVSSTLDRYFSAPSNVVTITRTAPGEEEHAPLSGTQR